MHTLLEERVLFGTLTGSLVGLVGLYLERSQGSIYNPSYGYLQRTI